MSKVIGSIQQVITLPRPERRRRAREIKKGLRTQEQRQILLEEGLSVLAQQAGLAALTQLMEEDANNACGVGGKWEQNPENRLGSRNGWGPGAVWIAGRWVRIERPRATRRGGGELPLESYQAAQNPEFLSNAVLTATVLGVSLRNHPKVVGAVSPGHKDLQTSGLSKSALGRRFIAAADEFVASFLGRRLDERYLVVWVDAVAEGGYSVLAAVGMTEDGTKKVLGLRQGSTETAAVCAEFLEELMGRGLSGKRGILWVVDGGAGMAKALREVFGQDVLLQRCRVHKKRNVLEKLTLKKDDAKQVAEALDQAWAAEKPALAKAKIEMLARGLEARGQGAAARSLREGAHQMLTACRLGIPLELMASFTNTNVIESTFSVHEGTAHRVKRWRNGKQVLRWVGAASYRAEQSFERVGTPESLAKLARALDLWVSKSSMGPRPLAIAA